MFETLENILIEIDEKLKKQEIFMKLLMPELKSKSAVAKILNTSVKKVTEYIENGKFQQNKHFYINDKGKIIFISEAIIEFKLNYINKVKEIKDEKKKNLENKKLDEITVKVLKGIVWVKVQQ